MVVILLYDDDVVLLFKLGAKLWRSLNKLYECALLLALLLIYFKPSLIFNRNKRELSQEAFYLGKTKLSNPWMQIFLELISIHMVTLIHRVKYKECRHDKIDGPHKEMNNNWSHILETQNLLIHRLNASNFYILHWNLGSCFKNLHWKVFEEA